VVIDYKNVKKAKEKVFLTQDKNFLAQLNLAGEVKLLKLKNFSH
jgi:hypothetical protein